jgi:ABC-type multidrug transport system fused ATPase/permease subunit
LNHSFKDITAILIPPERRRFFIAIFLDVLISILDIASIAFLVLLIHFYTQPSSVQPSFLPGWFFDRNNLVPLFIFLVFFAVKNTAGHLISRSQYRFVYTVASRLSQKNLLQYLEGSYTNYVTVDSSVHIKKISQQPIEFGHYVLWGAQQVIAQTILIAITITAMIIFNASLFFLLLIILTPAIIIIVYFSKTITRSAKEQIRANSEHSLQYLKEAISGFIESNLYDRNKFFAKRYISKQQELNQWLGRLQSLHGIPNRLIEVFAVFGFFVLLLVSRWTDNGLTPSIFTIGTFMAAAYKIIPGIVKILNSSAMIRTYENSIDKLFPPALPAQKINTSPTINELEYKNISFSYNGKKIFNQFNCVLRKGDFAGISGISGKGKTTAINLLLGFEEPDEGRILIDQQQADQLQRKQYWPNIAYVKQQPFLIHDTILNNITLGKENIDQEQLAIAIDAAGLKVLLAQYPEGLNKLLTENGKNISGGQRQRIVIARALYKNAGLIILDEPFNELDSTAENDLLAYFKTLANSGKIVILITHNTKSLSFCNRIISLDEN